MKRLIILIILTLTLVSCSSTPNGSAEADIIEKILGLDADDGAILLNRVSTEEDQWASKHVTIPKAQWVVVDKKTRLVDAKGNRISFDRLRCSEDAAVWYSGRTIILEDGGKEYPIASKVMLLESEPFITEEMPEDFNIVFKYGVGAKTVLDTIDSSFTKDFINGSTKMIELKLSDGELEEIYQKVMKTKFHSYPEIFESSLDAIHYPYNTFYLKVEIGGISKAVYWEAICGGATEGSEDLMDLCRYIISLIEMNKTYRDADGKG